MSSAKKYLDAAGMLRQWSITAVDAQGAEAVVLAMHTAAEKLDDAAAQITVTQMCAESACSICHTLWGMGASADVGFDDDGECCITIYHKQKLLGCGTVYWDADAREYQWSCHLTVNGQVFEGCFAVSQFPAGLAEAIAALQTKAPAQNDRAGEEKRDG